MESNPISSEEDYKEALKEIESLWDSPIDSPEGDRLEVLITSVETYENQHFPIPKIDDPVEILEYILESKGLSRSDLIQYIGSEGLVSDIFTHKRQLSLGMIRRIHEGLDIPLDLIIGKS